HFSSAAAFVYNRQKTRRPVMTNASPRAGEMNDHTPPRQSHLRIAMRRCNELPGTIAETSPARRAAPMW
ncbi:hypothetical protein, partial [Xanthomonas arboricola]|uniref:hypothetical protein n=1 Tax=Xanthomonas arboricola TaxID=56448 RepID=UPI001CC170BC